MKNFKFDKENHIYTLNDKPLTGVTTILQVISKPALIQWSADTACKYVKENLKDLESLDAVLAEARLAHRKKKELAADIGTGVHEQIERFAKGEPLASLDEQSQTMFNRFLEWQSESQAKFLESEKQVYSEKHWYAGTCDLVLEINGKVWIGDVKTSSGIYPEYYFQTAAYQNALQEMGEYPEIEGHIILNCKKTGGFEVETSYGYKQNIKAFLAALTIYRAQEELKAANGNGKRKNH